MPAGAPTKYDPAFIDKVDDYIKECGEWREGNIVKVKLPKVEGFAKYLGVVKQTLTNWSKEHPEFLVALEKIATEQADRLIDHGLAGTYNPTIAKLLLSANHGMAEKSEQDITSKGEKIEGFAVEFVRGKTADQNTGEV